MARVIHVGDSGQQCDKPLTASRLHFTLRHGNNSSDN